MSEFKKAHDTYDINYITSSYKAKTDSYKAEIAKINFRKNPEHKDDSLINM